MEAQRDFGDDSQRSFGADHQAREVITGSGFTRAPSGLDDLAAGEHHRQTQHVVAHGAVAHRIGPGSARRHHAADGRLCTRIDWEEQTLVAQVGVELLAHDARLDHAIQVRSVHRDDTGHARQVEAHATLHRHHLTFQGGAGAEGDDRQIVSRADLNRGCDLLGR